MINMFKRRKQYITIKNEYLDACQKSDETGNFYLMGSELVEKYLKSNTYNPHIDTLLDIYRDWDKVRAIPNELANDVQRIINDPTQVIGIHRTYDMSKGFYNNSILKNIVENGLINNGHTLSSGSYTQIPSPRLTVSFENNLLTSIILLKTSYSAFKPTNLAIIFSFPAEYITLDGEIIPGHEDDIYLMGDGLVRIKPEYIAGVAYINEKEDRIEYMPIDELKKELGNLQK